MGSTENEHELTPVVRKDGSAGLPARGYSWPPFEDGNPSKLVHGANHEPTIEARAAEVHAEILTVAPWLDSDEYAPAVARYLRAEARAQLLHAHIMATCETKGPDKVPSRVWEQATAADRLSAELGNVLGLDPIGRARLKQLASSAEISLLTLGELARQGRALRESSGSVDTKTDISAPPAIAETNPEHQENDDDDE